MKANSTIYDSGMTAIVLGIAKDGFVIAGDGKAIRTDTDEVYKLDMKKVHHISNGLFFGAATNGFALDEFSRIKGTLQHNLRLKLPYTMQAVAEDFYAVVDHLYKNEPNDFWVTFGLIGYGRDEENNATVPELYIFEKKNKTWSAFSLTPTEETPIPFGIFGTEKSHQDKISTVLPESVGELAEYAQEVIRKVEEADESVGGQIVTAIVKGNKWEEKYSKN